MYYIVCYNKLVLGVRKREERRQRRSYNETTVGTVVYAVEDRKLRD